MILLNWILLCEFVVWILNPSTNLVLSERECQVLSATNELSFSWNSSNSYNYPNIARHLAHGKESSKQTSESGQRDGKPLEERKGHYNSMVQSMLGGPEDTLPPASILVFIIVLHFQRLCCHCWHCHFLGQDVHLCVLRVHLCCACCMARQADSSDCKLCHPALGYSGKVSCKESHVSIHPMSPRGSGNKNIGTFIFF